MKPTRPTKSRGKTPEPFNALDWFYWAGAFRLEEFVAAYAASGRRASSAADLLKYHVAQHNLYSIRRGLYCHSRLQPDPWVLGCTLTADAVLAYDGAASYLRLMDSGYSVTILSAQRLDDVELDDIEYRRVSADEPRAESQVEKARVGRHDVYVTTKERTLVDLLDRPELGRSTHDIVQAFRRAGRVSQSELLKRVKKLGSATTAMRLGFFLEHFGPKYRPLLEELEKFRPEAPIYFQRADRKGQHMLLKRWNLVAPTDLVVKLERGR